MFAEKISAWLDALPPDSMRMFAMALGKLVVEEGGTDLELSR